jgi:HlyD family secretion protein
MQLYPRRMNSGGNKGTEMKRGIVVIVLLVVAAALVGGWWWVRQAPDQVTQLLVDGGLEASRAQAFVDLIGGHATPEEENVLIASGSVEGEAVSIVSEFGGQIVDIYAGEGDEVEAGQVLVRLDDSLLEAQMAKAKAAVQVAEADLASVRAGTHPAEILAAQAALHQAIAGRNASRTGWQSLQLVLDSPQEIEAQLVEARTAVELAALRVEQAEAELESAIVQRDHYRAQGTLEEKKLYAAYDYRVQAAQAALDAAKADRAGARQRAATLAALRDNPLSLVSQVHSAEAQFKVAAAGVGVAAAKLDELKASARQEEVAVAEAQVSRAQAAAAALQVQIEKMALISPVDGVVTSRSAQPGEAALAGVILLTVANLEEVTLTIYVPEDQLNRVYLGQEVEVRVDSFPQRVFTGTVSYISQQAEFTPKNVQTQEDRVNMVFAVKVRLPNLDHLLKPGMPADATIRN